MFLRTVPDAAAIGAALRAKHGYLCSRHASDDDNASDTAATPHGIDGGGDGGGVDGGRQGGGAYVPFSRVLGEGGGEMRLAASPRPEAKTAYDGMAERSVDGDWGGLRVHSLRGGV